MSRIRSVLAILFEPTNLITIVGVVVAAVLAYSGIVNNNTQQALTAILAVLSALAIAQIVSGYEASKSAKIIEKIENAMHKLGGARYPPLMTRTELISLQDRAQNATDVLIVGRTAVAILRQTDFFREKIRQGAIIRVAFTNPANSIVMEALTPLAETSREGLMADLQSTIGLVKRMKEQSSNPQRFSELLQIRVFNYVPTLSLVMVDGHLPNGHIVVEMVPYQIAPTSRPLLYITAKDHPVWFAYFRNVCKSIWDDAEDASFLFSSGKQNSKPETLLKTSAQ